MKTFYKTFVDSMETQYRSSIAYLAGQYNSSIKLNVFAANDGTDTVRVEIQRMIRLESKQTGVNSRDQDRDGAETGTSKFAGNALIQRLNQLQRVTWKSVEVVPGEEKIIGVSVGPNEEKDVLGDASGYQTTISNKVYAMMEEMNEIILNELVKDVPLKQIIKNLITDGSNDKAIFTSSQRAINHVTLKVDEFKKYTGHDKLLGLYHPDAVSSLGRFKGEIYQSVPELFDTGVKADFQIDGIRGFKEPGLNALAQRDVSAAQDGSELENIMGIIYDIEGLATGDPQGQKTDFDNVIVGQRYVGTRWTEIVKHFDKERIVLLTGTLSSTDLSATTLVSN